LNVHAKESDTATIHAWRRIRDGIYLTAVPKLNLKRECLALASRGAPQPRMEKLD
jgi:hypothetical protein